VRRGGRERERYPNRPGCCRHRETAPEGLVFGGHFADHREETVEGGVPVAGLDGLLEHCFGRVFTGGNDLDPVRARREVAVVGDRPVRDALLTCSPST